MEQLSNILAGQHFVVKKSKRKVNVLWEQANEFAAYTGLTTPFVLRCFKTYGIGKVLQEKSFLKDAPCTDQDRPGLLVWRLKGGKFDDKN